MNIEEIKDRVNLTKNAFHKLGIEGQVNINVMLNDIEFLLKEIEELKALKREILINRIPCQFLEDYISKDKIKAKIEEYEEKIRRLKKKSVWEEPYDTEKYVRYTNYISVLQSLLEKE